MRMHYFATEISAESSARTIDERAGRCYELAATAMINSKLPVGSLLVHGTMHGVTASRRIGHAWILLGDDYCTIWEPMMAQIWHIDMWNAVARPEIHVTYTVKQVIAQLIEFMHYGPWPQRTQVS